MSKTISTVIAEKDIVVTSDLGDLATIDLPGSPAGEFLKDDGTWDTPSGGGGGPVVPNLVYNGFLDEFGFSFMGGSSPVPERYPDFWTLNNGGTYATPLVEKSSAQESGYGSYCTKITATDFYTGTDFTLGWLKPLTTYKVKIRAKVATGDAAILTTTGADTTQISQSFTNDTWADISGTFTTDSTPTSVVLHIFGNTVAGGDVIYVEAVGVWEGTTAGSYDRGLPVHNFPLQAGEGDYVTATLDTDSGTNSILRYNFDDTTEEQVRTALLIPGNVNKQARVEYQWVGYSKTLSLGANVKMNAYWSAAYLGQSWDNSWSSAVSSGDIATTPGSMWSQDYMESIRWSGLATDIYSGDLEPNEQAQLKLTRSSASSNNLTGDWCGTYARVRIPLK